MRAIGIDIGGTKVAMGALDVPAPVTGGDPVPASTGPTVEGYVETPLPTREYDALLQLVADGVRHLRAQLGGGGDAGEPPPVIGVAMAAWLSPDRERVLTAANLGWSQCELRRDVEAVTGLATTVHNDGNCAAWGEYLLSDRVDGKLPDTLVMLTLGTDVGGGVVVGGRLLTGPTGLAGELGHLRVAPDGPPCVCGSRGCLAVYASGTAMLARARAALQGADPSSAISASLLSGLCAGDPARLDGRMLASAAQQGDPTALEVVSVAAAAIAAASGQISRVIDHDVLVLGGGASAVGDALVEAVRQALTVAAPVGPIRPLPAVTPARAGSRAGVLGAAHLAARELRPRPTGPAQPSTIDEA